MVPNVLKELAETSKFEEIRELCQVLCKIIEKLGKEAGKNGEQRS